MLWCVGEYLHLFSCQLCALYTDCLWLRYPLDQLYATYMYFDRFRIFKCYSICPLQMFIKNYVGRLKLENGFFYYGTLREFVEKALSFYVFLFCIFVLQIWFFFFKYIKAILKSHYKCENKKKILTSWCGLGKLSKLIFSACCGNIG